MNTINLFEKTSLMIPTTKYFKIYQLSKNIKDIKKVNWHNIDMMKTKYKIEYFERK